MKLLWVNKQDDTRSLPQASHNNPLINVKEVLFLTGVSICTLSQKLPMNAMMVIFCMSRSILLNCIMKRSSSVRLSTGLRSFSNCRMTLISFSVGWNRIRHSTKSTGRVRKSKLKHRRDDGH